MFSVTPYTPSASTLWPCRQISVGLLPSGACDEGLNHRARHDSVDVNAEVAEDFGVKAGVGGIRPPAGGDDPDPRPFLLSEIMVFVETPRQSRRY